MHRRNFLKSGILATATVGSGLGLLQGSGRKSLSKQKRELILSLINEDKPQEYFPAGFFIHFGEGYKSGEAAIQKHLEYFRFTNMDFMTSELHIKDMAGQACLCTKRIFMKNPSL